MTSPAAVSINDNLAARKPRVALRAADNEFARGIDENARITLHEFCRNNRFNDVFDKVFANLFQSNIFVMLGGNNDGFHSHRLAVFISHRHLSLAVRAQVRQRAVLADFGQAACQTLCQSDGQWHEFRRLIGGITKHHALVTGTNGIGFIQFAFTGFERLINALRDIRGLFVKGYQNTAGLVVKTISCIGIADFLNGAADNLGNIHIAAGRNFTDHMHLTGSHQCFTRHTALWVLGDNRVQNTVGNLVSHFIGMTFRY